jgi:hypothetical protein
MYSPDSRYGPLHSHWVIGKDDNKCRIWHELHPDDPASSRPVHFASQVFPCDAKSAHSRFRIRFSDDYKPPDGQVLDRGAAARKQCPTFIKSPECLAQWGWTQWVEDLKADLSILSILNSMPSLKHVKRWSERSIGYRVERGLLILSSFVEDYLRHGNNKMKASAASLAHHLTEGQVSL